MSSKYERLLAEDRAKNTSPRGVAGPTSAITFTTDAGINLHWHPPLAPGGVYHDFRGEAGTVFAVPEGDALSFIFDNLPTKLPGFSWVWPPSPELLQAQHAAFSPGRYPGWGTGATEFQTLIAERAKLPAKGKK